MKKIIFILCIVTSSLGCEGEVDADCQENPSLRKGAKCNDGSTSTATGSGACSSHGGVDYWLCK